MRIWKLLIRPLSLQLTRWEADTIFGSLCWQLRFREGEDALKRFLQPYRDGDPPFLFSDGFPAGYLPLPFFTRLLQSDSVEDVETYSKLKRMKKVRFLPESEFAKACDGQLVEVGDEVLVKAESQLHASINRITGTTVGGGEDAEASLFQLSGWVPGDKNQEIEVSIADRSGAGIDSVLSWFADLEKAGFGKKKSSGMGAFRMEGAPQEWRPPTPAENADGFVSLSAFIPRRSDPSTGFWQCRVKHGKMGEEYATGGSPFKKPWILLEPGSAFYTETAPAEFYGRMLENVSDDYPDVVQYGYAFPIPIRFPRRLLENAS